MPVDNEIPANTPKTVEERRAKATQEAIDKQYSDMLEVGEIFRNVFSSPMGQSALGCLQARFISRPLQLPLPNTRDAEVDYMLRTNVRRGQTEVINYIMSTMAMVAKQTQEVTDGPAKPKRAKVKRTKSKRRK